MSTKALLGPTSSSNKRLAWLTMDAFGIRAILPRPKGEGLPRIRVKNDPDLIGLRGLKEFQRLTS